MEISEDEEKLILIFMSDHGRWVLSRSEMLYIDGTFSSAPEPFTQLYFVLGKMPDKRAVPVCFALLPNKETATYRKLWEVITSLVVFENGCPRRIFLDFERAAINAVVAALPRAKMCGCIFHQQKVIHNF
jgi:hypothetical protein